MDGEYSKLEKDFLGNERMVHYNAEGVAISASRVERSEDGSMIVGEPVPLSADAKPDNSTNTPKPAPVAAEPPRGTYPPGTITTIGIASFVVAALAALFILKSYRSDSAADRFNTAVYREPVQVPTAPERDNLEQVPGPQDLDSPVPRQEDETLPGDRERPRIDLRDEEPPAQDPAGEPPKSDPKPEVKAEPEPRKGSDPIDLRGDGDESR